MRLRGKKDRLEQFIQAPPATVILEPTVHKGKWREFFGNDRPIHAELGMGKGRFITQMCAQHPDINYIGIDMFDDLVRRAAEKAAVLMAEGVHPAAAVSAIGRWDADEPESADKTNEQPEPSGKQADGGGSSADMHDEQRDADDLQAEYPPNLALVRYNIEKIAEVFDSGELSRIYLNFSDPWPKTRHVRRRLTHPRFLRQYREMLDESGEIHMKTDSRLLFEYSLNVFANLNLRMRNIRLDLHADGPVPGNVMTEYESKFSKQGKPIHRVEVIVGGEALKVHLAELEARSED